MNANEALKLSQKYWSEHEQEFLKYIVGYQTKIENATNEGRVTCSVATIPSGNPGLMDFTASYFEEQGFFVTFQGTQSGDIVVGLNWKLVPVGSRPYYESLKLQQDLNNFLENLQPKETS